MKKSLIFALCVASVSFCAYAMEPAKKKQKTEAFATEGDTSEGVTFIHNETMFIHNATMLLFYLKPEATCRNAEKSATGEDDVFEGIRQLYIRRKNHRVMRNDKKSLLYLLKKVDLQKKNADGMTPREYTESLGDLMKNIVDAIDTINAMRS